MKTSQRKQRAVKTEERKAWEREQRISRLVDIVQELFFTRGYDGTTVDDIARAAGYTKRSIYLYFKDRDDLFLAVVRRGQELFKEMLEKALSENTSSDAPQVINMGRAFYRFSLEHPQHFNLLLIYESRLHRYYMPEGEPDDGSFKSQCQKISFEYGRLVMTAIENDIKNGWIKTRLSARQLMLLLWGQILGVMQIILMRKESFRDAYGINPEELFDEYIQMVMKSLK
jgi:AcrR family transcriptional regulator